MWKLFDRVVDVTFRLCVVITVLIAMWNGLSGEDVVLKRLDDLIVLVGLTLLFVLSIKEKQNAD